VADIEKICESARKRKAQSDQSVGWPLAVIKAIEGQGIRNRADINRLKPVVLEALGIRKRNKVTGRLR